MTSNMTSDETRFFDSGLEGGPGSMYVIASKGQAARNMHLFAFIFVSSLVPQ